MWGHSGRGRGGTLTIQSEIRFNLRKEKEGRFNNRHMKPRGGGRERAAGGRGPGPPGAPEPGAPRTASPGLPSPPSSNLTAPPGARPSQRLQPAALHRGLGPVNATRPGLGLSREAGGEAGAPRVAPESRCGDGPRSCRPAGERYGLRGSAGETRTVGAA